jgi:hypothetical protein
LKEEEKIMAKARGNTDVAEIADSRINDNLDFSEISDEESYHRAVKNFLRIGKSGDPVKNRGDHLIKYLDRDSEARREMYEKSSAKKLVDSRIAKEKADSERLGLLRRAQMFERRRPKRSRIPDERKTARKIYPLTRRGIRTWIHNKGRTGDVRSVDTRRIRRIALRNQINGQDLRLKNIKVILNKQGVKQYKDLQGRFRSSPYKRFRR